MDSRIKGLIIFGIVLFALGLVASFYSLTKYPFGGPITYPYQGLGIVLDVAGIVFVALGLLYPSRKTLPSPTNRIKGLIAFGIVLLLTGIVAYLYYYSDYDPHFGIFVRNVYPYQSLGVVLVAVGILCVVLGFLVSFRKKQHLHNSNRR